MKEKPKISIVVPVYGVERYIENCIRSLCEQTWTNLEILLVDDGSKDRSGKICDEWALKDSRIRVFHVENGGQSRPETSGSGRPPGLYRIRGRDDAVSSRMYEILLEAMKESGARIGECDFTRQKKSCTGSDRGGQADQDGGKEAIRRQLDSAVSSRFPSTSLWSKLFEASMIRDLRLPEGRIHEEYAFLCQAFVDAILMFMSMSLSIIERCAATAPRPRPFRRELWISWSIPAEKPFSEAERGNGSVCAFQGAGVRADVALLWGSVCSRLEEIAVRLKAEMKRQRREILSSGLSEKKKGQYRSFFLSPELYAEIRKWKRRRKR